MNKYAKLQISNHIKIIHLNNFARVPSMKDQFPEKHLSLNDASIGSLKSNVPPIFFKINCWTRSGTNTQTCSPFFNQY